MILSDSALKEALKNKEIVIEPLAPNAIQPASIDIRIGNSFKIVDTIEMMSIDKSYIDLSKDSEYSVKYMDVIDVNSKSYTGTLNELFKFYGAAVVDDGLILLPHKFALATTMEYIKIPNYLTAWIEARSSIGRTGLFIQNAGWIDPGFEGELTLELYNALDLPIYIKAGTRVAQLVFSELTSPAENSYNGKYQKQTGATGSKINEDKD